jgi:plasmid replication initiation protein
MDLVPAIDWVRIRKGKKVEYIGFSIPDPRNPKQDARPLLGMVSKTDTQRVLGEADLRKFILPALV